MQGKTIVLFIVLSACTDGKLPVLNVDSSIPEYDAQVNPEDSGSLGVHDSGEVDTSVVIDSGSIDCGSYPDAQVPDFGLTIDASKPDLGFVDAGSLDSGEDLCQNDILLQYPRDGRAVSSPVVCLGPLESTQSPMDGDWMQLNYNNSQNGGFVSVYYIYQGKRWLVPMARIWESWRGEDACQSCADVKLADVPTVTGILPGGNLTIRPGTYLVKIRSDPKVYAIEGCTLRWLETEAIAEGLYGPNWADQVIDIPDIYFADYIIGVPVTSTTGYDRQAALNTTIEEVLSCWL